MTPGAVSYFYGMGNKQNDYEGMRYIRALLQNDSKVIREIYKNFYPMIRRLVCQNGGRELEAEDVFQDAILEIYKRAQRPDFRLSCRFSTLLWSFSYIIWRNLLKKFGNEILILPPEMNDLIDIPDFDFKEFERQKMFDNAFLKLGKDCQKLLQLFFDGFSMQEIAKRMGFRSEKYARVRKHECKEKLIELIKKQPGFDELRND